MVAESKPCKAFQQAQTKGLKPSSSIRQRQEALIIASGTGDADMIERLIDFYKVLLGVILSRRLVASYSAMSLLRNTLLKEFDL